MEYHGDEDEIYLDEQEIYNLKYDEDAEEE